MGIDALFLADGRIVIQSTVSEHFLPIIYKDYEHYLFFNMMNKKKNCEDFEFIVDDDDYCKIYNMILEENPYYDECEDIPFTKEGFEIIKKAPKWLREKPFLWLKKPVKEFIVSYYNIKKEYIQDIEDFYKDDNIYENESENESNE